MSQNITAAAVSAVVNRAPVTAAASALVEFIVNCHASRSGRVYAPALADEAAQAAVACVSPFNTSPDVIRSVTEAVFSSLIARVMRPGAAEAAAMSDDELVELYNDRRCLYSRERMRICDMLYVAEHAAQAMNDELEALVNTAKAFSTSSSVDDRLRLHAELVTALYGARVNLFNTIDAAIAPSFYDARHVTIVDDIITSYARAMNTVLDYTSGTASVRLFAAEAYNEADVLGYYSEKARYTAQALDV